MNRINFRLFLALFLAFIIATIVGTISHELGHYLVAKSLGYEAEINYAYTYYPNDDISNSDRVYVILGGPLQTMITGTLGFILLLTFRKSFRSVDQLSSKQWILIFLTLFWLRQIFNLILSTGGFIMKKYVSMNSDEIKLSRYLQLPDLCISIITGGIGILIVLYTFFKFIPVKQRSTFILSAFTGGISGYILWIILLGKYIMP